MRRSLGLLIVGALSAVGCSRAASAPAPSSALCRDSIHAVAVEGRWSVELAVRDAVLARHGAKLRAKTLEPNGEAWAGILEQCAPAELRGVELDPEAGALHAWAATDADKDRLVSTLCRAIDDAPWLDACLARLDRSKIDD